MASSGGNLANEFAALFAKLQQLPDGEKDCVLSKIQDYVSPRQNAKLFSEREDPVPDDIPMQSLQKDPATPSITQKRSLPLEDSKMGEVKNHVDLEVEATPKRYRGITTPGYPKKRANEPHVILPEIIKTEGKSPRTYTRNKKKKQHVNLVPDKEAIVRELEVENVSQGLNMSCVKKENPEVYESEDDTIDHPITYPYDDIGTGEVLVSKDCDNVKEVKSTRPKRTSQNPTKSQDDGREIIFSFDGDEESGSDEKGHGGSDDDFKCSNSSASAKTPRQKRIRAGDGRLTCEVEGCGFLAKYPSRLAVHMTKHTGDKPFVCPTCGQAFSQKSTLTQHTKSHIDPNSCSECDFQTITLKKLNKHIRIAHPELQIDLQVCCQCGQQCRDRKAFRSHMKIEHGESVNEDQEENGDPPEKIVVSCPVCTKPISQAFLPTHMQQHAATPSHVCQMCGKTFNLRRYLIAHIRLRHDERKFDCAMCDKTFESLAKLQRHEMVHSSIKPFGCPFCSYRANVKDNVCKHARTIHRVLDFNASQVLVAKSALKDPTESTLMEVYDENDGELLVLPKKQQVDVKVHLPVEKLLENLQKVMGRPVSIEEMKSREIEKQRLVMEKRRISSMGTKRERFTEEEDEEEEIPSESYE